MSRTHVVLSWNIKAFPPDYVITPTFSENTPFGIRYAIEGPLVAPDGRQLQVRTVWFIDEAGQVPRFVTAYPLKQRTP